MDYSILYDPTKPESIENYARKLIGHTFQDVLNLELLSRMSEDGTSYGNSDRKGGLGNLLEEQYFGYKSNSNMDPDFPEAGVELKVSPYEIKKNGEYRAGERLVLTMISYTEPVEEDFYKSHLWLKSNLILLIYYLRDKDLLNNLKYRIDFVKLFTPSETDLKIIMHDYDIIINKLKAGKAHEISEGDTMYLGACTKGASAIKSTVPQFYAPNILAKKRAFCFKNSYMTSILNQYIIPNHMAYEPILKNINQLKDQSFECYIVNQINQFAGKTDAELCKLFSCDYNGNKSQWIQLVYRMLGVKSNRAEEFIKANIVLKAIRIEENGTMRESSPLPPFKFKELLNETWEESSLNEYLETTKFLFVVFKKEGSFYKLKGSQLWNMPYNDLNNTVYEGWKQTKRIVEHGLILTKSGIGRNLRIKNNLPKKEENSIIHVRPHTSKRFYILEEGEVIGNGTLANSDQLPDGRRITTQSFWLNNTYIISQLNEGLKN